MTMPPLYHAMPCPALPCPALPFSFTYLLEAGLTMYTFPNFEVENMAVQLIGAPDQNCRLRTMGFHLQGIRILLWILIPTLWNVVWLHLWGFMSLHGHAWPDCEQRSCISSVDFMGVQRVLDPITNKRFFTPASIRNLIRLKIADCEQTAGWFYLQDIWNSLRIQIADFIKRSWNHLWGFMSYERLTWV